MKMHRIPIEPDFDEVSIKRRDIRSLLRAYNAAIALDQSKVDALPKESFHPEYSRGMWFRWRQHQIEIIDNLFDTTQHMPKKLLASLTVLAAQRDPIIVRETMVELIGQNVSLSAGQIDTAPLFFQALLESVGNRCFERDIDCDCKDSKMRMMQWISPIDPLRIAEDPECGYLESLKKSMQNA